jgi:GNAT superfamily N-acetyltransferase
MPGVEVMAARPEHAEGMAALQLTCFPTLAAEEIFRAEHYRRHLEIFPEGQMVALDGERVVGATTTLRLAFDFEHADHTFAEIIAGGWLSTHQPQGGWLYGADLAVDPAYRGRGVGKALYAARQDLVRQLGLAGQVTAGMISGYGAMKERMSAETYYAGLVAGEVRDPTVSMQMAMGFEPRGLIRNYLNDPVCDRWGVLLVMDANKDVPRGRG